ncbi:MAG TPA: OmpA family protein [Gemmatimonadales bacterium]|nr:OmpA family protein [Gemmatimonadales bacterium]
MRTTAGLALTIAALLLPAAVTAQTRIPLCPGLTYVGSVSGPGGDYEPIVTVEAVTARAVELSYSAQLQTSSGIVNNDTKRTVLLEDLANATVEAPWFSPTMARTIPGTTAMGPSRAVLRALKAGDTVKLGVFTRDASDLPARRDVHPNAYENVATYPLHRVEPQPVMIPVTVNGERVTLPAIHAAGTYFNEHTEFFLLDDEDNPMSLGSRTTLIGGGPPTGSRAVKITFRCGGSSARLPETAADRLERSLRETGRAEVYDIYFDFNSDRIRQASDSTLQDIVTVLKRHPDWKLSIEGHTDSIASDRFNLELSQRRAVAVKTALTGKYAIDGGRLTTAGYGESRPLDRNDTPEGRARNRRVELVRTP